MPAGAGAVVAGAEVAGAGAVVAGAVVAGAEVAGAGASPPRGTPRHPVGVATSTTGETAPAGPARRRLGDLEASQVAPSQAHGRRERRGVTTTRWCPPKGGGGPP